MDNNNLLVIADENIGYLSRALSKDLGIAAKPVSSSGQAALKVLLNPDSIINNLRNCHCLLICIKISTLLLYTVEGDEASTRVHRCVEIFEKLIMLVRSSNKTLPVFITKISPLGMGTFTLAPAMSLNEQYAFCNSFNNAVYSMSLNDHALKVSDLIIAHSVGDEKSYKTYLRTKTYTSLHTWQALSDEVCRHVYVVNNKLPKLIFVDLDNTLWGGIISDSFENIRLGGHDPVGEAYVHIQLYLKELSKCGVLLAIVSKNDKSTISEFFDKRSDMPLSFANFVACEANWERKSVGIGKILKALRLRAQDCALLDDSMHERAEVAKTYPEIRLLEFPVDVYKRLLYLERVLPLSQEPPTEEDKNRLKFYKQMNLREKELERINANKSSVQNLFDEWLNSLDTYLSLSCIWSGVLEHRIFQLYNRTNQFNMTGEHLYSEAIVDHLKHGSILISGSVKDKYGNDGIAISAIVAEVGTSLIFQEFVMSCRIIGRFVEDAFVRSVCKRFERINRLEFRFNDTGKNSAFMVFKDRICDCNREDCTIQDRNVASVQVELLESILKYDHVKIEWS